MFFEPPCTTARIRCAVLYLLTMGFRHAPRMSSNADGNTDSLGLSVHKIPVAMPTSRYKFSLSERRGRRRGLSNRNKLR
jgi:hypothetical protein